MQSLAEQAQQSAEHPSQQTTESLAVFDNALSSVADFVSGPNSSFINDTVSNL